MQKNAQIVEERRYEEQGIVLNPSFGGEVGWYGKQEKRKGSR